jgi:hypothetical protein
MRSKRRIPARAGVKVVTASRAPGFHHAGNLAQDGHGVGKQMECAAAESDVEERVGEGQFVGTCARELDVADALLSYVGGALP